jgi:hypothetical protein
MKFVIFTYLIFNITNNYIFIPSLRQYAKIGFDIGLYFVATSLAIRIIITFLEYRIGETKEADEKDDFEEEQFTIEMETDKENITSDVFTEDEI